MGKICGIRSDIFSSLRVTETGGSFDSQIERNKHRI